MRVPGHQPSITTRHDHQRSAGHGQHRSVALTCASLPFTIASFCGCTHAFDNSTAPTPWPRWIRARVCDSPDPHRSPKLARLPPSTHHHPLSRDSQHFPRPSRLAKMLTTFLLSLQMRRPPSRSPRPRNPSRRDHNPSARSSSGSLPQSRPSQATGRRPTSSKVCRPSRDF